MLRVLVAVEDYSEMLYLQTLLKKIGFDVEGVQNERSFEDTRLSLNPEIILISATGKKLKGIEFAANIRKIRGFPKIVLLFGPQGSSKLSIDEIPGVEAFLETPVHSKVLLTVLARLGELDLDALLEKYRKIKANLSPENDNERELLKRYEPEDDTEVFDSKTQAEPGETRPRQQTDRASRYKEFLSKMEKPTQSGFSREQVVKYHKNIRAEENPEDLADLEKDRQSFVKALFVKPTPEE